MQSHSKKFYLNINTMAEAAKNKRFIKVYFLYASENKKLVSISKSIQRTPCTACTGARINKNLHKLKILDIAFVDFLTMPIDMLHAKLGNNIDANNLSKVLKAIVDVGLGYLSLARAIPSLSGGELQKLKLSRLLHSDISGVLFVIDEISAQINQADHPIFLKKFAK